MNQGIKQLEQSILDKAKEIIYGDRERTYGNPGKNLENISYFWNNYLSCKYKSYPHLVPEDICQMMILLKVARLMNDSTHLDSLIDICGYAALQERIQQKERKE